jgi:DNA recombination protein RmuC
MELSYLALGTGGVAVAAFIAILWIGYRLGVLLRRQADLPSRMERVLEERHLAMIKDLNSGLHGQADRLTTSQTDASERLRGTVSQDLKQTRDAMLVLQLSQTEELSGTRETMSQRLSNLAADLQMKHDELRTELLGKVLERLAERARSDQELIQTTLRNVSQHLASAIESLTKTTDARLEHIGGKVTERLEEGFKKTNETFVNVMTRLATIDEAQKKIDSLTTNVVSLQELLGDKRSRGAFGEVQLEALITNLLPPTAYVFQYTLSNGTRADCVLMLPEPTGMVALDSKFPLENYHRMFEPGTPDIEKLAAKRQFRADLRKHVEEISSKYIIAGETSDGAVMFVPAEAVFAEIHAHHGEVVDYAMQRRVWIVSPTTMMAVLNTARAVLKDVETRRQVHIIKDELSKLGREFSRFDQRMKKLADHIRQAHQDAEEVRVTSDKISRRFSQIERVELEHLESVTRMEQALRESEAPALPGPSS